MLLLIQSTDAIEHRRDWPAHSEPQYGTIRLARRGAVDRHVGAGTAECHSVTFSIDAAYLYQFFSQRRQRHLCQRFKRKPRSRVITEHCSAGRVCRRLFTSQYRSD